MKMKKIFWLGLLGFGAYTLWKMRAVNSLAPSASGPIYAGIPEVPQYVDPMQYAIQPLSYAGAQEDLMADAKQLMAQAQEMMANL